MEEEIMLWQQQEEEERQRFEADLISRIRKGLSTDDDADYLAAVLNMKEFV